MEGVCFRCVPPTSCGLNNGRPTIQVYLTAGLYVHLQLDNYSAFSIVALHESDIFYNITFPIFIKLICYGKSLLHLKDVCFVLLCKNKVKRSRE